MTEIDGHLATSGKGRITAAALTFDKLGRPIVVTKIELDHVDSLPTLLRQCQALEIAFSFTTKANLPELFE